MSSIDSGAFGCELGACCLECLCRGRWDSRVVKVSHRFRLGISASARLWSSKAFDRRCVGIVHVLPKVASGSAQEGALHAPR